jgi:hypothetical protein
MAEYYTLHRNSGGWEIWGGRVEVKPGYSVGDQVDTFGADDEEEAREHCNWLNDSLSAHLGAWLLTGQRDALDVPLPADVVVGGATFRKGVSLLTFVMAARRWHREACPEFYTLTAEQKAANLAYLQGRYPDGAEFCRFPDCKCPMDPGPEPDWCAKGLPHARGVPRTDGGGS